MKKKRDVLFPLGDEVRIQVRKVKLTVILSFIVCVTFGSVNSEVRDKSIGQVEKVAIPGSLQQQKLSGTITDATTGEPVIGVNVVIEGTTIGVVSDANGKFTIEIAKSDGVLVVSFIGYNSERIIVNGQSNLEIKLVPDITKLDEVVVVGYGTQKKATLTGSVVTVKGETIIQSPSTNITNNLVGRLPGLTAVTPSGEPGNDASILRIRGSNTLGDNSPLIVVDGIAGRSMQRLDPSDIESVTVLKDASAAIYGAQAANGVILVTTKRGKAGNTVITLSLNAGFNKPTVLPKMTNAFEYGTLLNELDVYNGRTPRYSADDLQKYKDGSDPWSHPNTDWFGSVIKPHSSQNQENISVSGGNDKMKYLLSMGARYTDGFYYNSATNFKLYNFRANIDGKISENIDLSFDFAGREEIKNYPTQSSWEIFGALLTGKPTIPAHWPDGSPGPDVQNGWNAAVTSTSATGYNKTKTYVIESNIRLNIIIPWVKGLSLQGNASLDKPFSFNKSFAKPWYLYSWDGNPEHITKPAKRGHDTPELRESMDDAQTITLNALATYENKFGSNNLKILVGTERQTYKQDNFNAYRRNYLSTSIDQLFAGGDDLYKSNGGSGDQNTRLNYFGRVNYDYNNKYLLEFVWRYDGSSKFPAGKQFGFFPGISAGWRVSDEAFWKNNISFINNFKLRGSWGKTGNDRIDPYQYLATYSYYNGGSTTFSPNTTTEQKILIEGVAPNPNITWEVANQSDVGFDMGLLNNKLSIQGDYFYYKRTDILWWRDASVPGSTGLSLPRENIGKVANQGFELVVSYGDNKNELKYNFSINGGYAKNKILFWDETPGIPEWQKSTGHPMNAPLRYERIGIFKDASEIDSYAHLSGAQPGDQKYLDKNNDGVIDGLDQVRIDKTNIPTFTGGFSTNLQYKQFDLSFLIQGATGAETGIGWGVGDFGNYAKDYYDNRWTPENPNGKYPSQRPNSAPYGSSETMKNMDYVRLKNMEVGYSLPPKVTKALRINKLRVYLNGLNLVTFSRMINFDPESPSESYNYPLQKILNAGLTLTF